MANWMRARAAECRTERNRLLNEAAAARAIAHTIVVEADELEQEALTLDQLVCVLDPRGRSRQKRCVGGHEE